MQKITVKIKAGKTSIETSGFSGSSCQDATKNLESKLGSVTSDTPTEEMYSNEQTHTLDQ